MTVLSLSTFPKHLSLHNIDKREHSKPFQTELYSSRKLKSAAAHAGSLCNSAPLFLSFHLGRTMQLCLCLREQNGNMCILSAKDGVMNKNTAPVCVSWFVEQI